MIGIILAGGRGTRMNSSIPKVLHHINGQTMIERIVRQMQLAAFDKIFIIVNPDNKDAIDANLSSCESISLIVQEEPKGTGHAIMCFFKHIDKNDLCSQSLLVCNGDTPLLRHSLFTQMASLYPFGLCAFAKDDPTGYGRVIVGEDHLLTIVEEKDCNRQQKLVRLCNAGIYLFPFDALEKVIPFLVANNQQREFYLTDAIRLLQDREKLKCNILTLDPHDAFMVEGINYPKELASIDSIFHLEFAPLRRDHLSSIPSLLSRLSHCPYDATVFLERFKSIENDPAIKIYTAYHPMVGLIAMGSLYILRKFAHSASSVGQIEDVVVHRHLDNEGIGTKLITLLIRVARESGCYKVVLTSAEGNFLFYQKLGFCQHHTQFEIRF